MTIREWHNFNKDFIPSDFVVTVLKSGSRLHSDTILNETPVSSEALTMIFGDFEIIKHSIGAIPRPVGIGSTFRIALWSPVNKSED